MAGRFNGLSRSQWRILKSLFSKPSKMDRPGVSWKKICNSILWILITGARWCDLPKGRQWASRSTAHRWLGYWEVNGTLNDILQKLRDCAEMAGLLNFERLSVDGFFFGRQRRRRASRLRLQGKGVTTHLLVDGEGNPLSFEVTSAKGNERQQVEKLITQIEEKISRLYRLYQLIPILEADKGYDSNDLRYKLLKRKIFPFIPYRRMGAAKKAEKIISELKKWRWKVERAIAWIQRKFRRIAVRWERRIKYWKGLLNFSLIHFWIERLLG